MTRETSLCHKKAVRYKAEFFALYHTAFYQIGFSVSYDGIFYTKYLTEILGFEKSVRYFCCFS